MKKRPTHRHVFTRHLRLRGPVKWGKACSCGLVRSRVRIEGDWGTHQESWVTIFRKGRDWVLSPRCEASADYYRPNWTWSGEYHKDGGLGPDHYFRPRRRTSVAG